MPYEVYKADPARYDTMPFRRCGRSGLMLPVISFGLAEFRHRQQLRQLPPDASARV